MLKFCSLLGKLCCNKEKLLDIIRTLKQIISLKLTKLVCKVILKKEKEKKVCLQSGCGFKVLLKISQKFLFYIILIILYIYIWKKFGKKISCNLKL